MAINLRTIGPVLHADLKSAAAKAGKPLEFFCLLLLREALTARGGSSDGRAPVVTTQEVEGSTPSPRSKTPDRREPVPRRKSEFGRIANQIDAVVAEHRAKHDPKNCTVYRCGMCAALKG